VSLLGGVLSEPKMFNLDLHILQSMYMQVRTALRNSLNNWLVATTSAERSLPHWMNISGMNIAWLPSASLQTSLLTLGPHIHSN
jgi:hypothetical protein